MQEMNRERRVDIGGGMAKGIRSALIIMSLPTMVAMSAQVAPHDAGLSEPDAAVVVPLVKDPDMAVELEDRLIILPEIKREGERFFLSSFKLPDKLTFAGQAVPLDNW